MQAANPVQQRGYSTYPESESIYATTSRRKGVDTVSWRATMARGTSEADDINEEGKVITRYSQRTRQADPRVIFLPRFPQPYSSTDAT